MSDQFVAEIRIFGCNFAPTGWAQCNGQLLPISQNTALFSLLGTYYGGDGKSTFGLPNFQGAIPVSQGQGPGLSPWDLGEQRGSDNVTLLASEMPLHNHTLNARPLGGNAAVAAANVPSGGVWVQGAQSGVVHSFTTTAPDTQMNPQALAVTGGSQPHNNLMPFVVVNFCIALQGVFPQRP